MEIKYKKKLDDFKYLLMFDLASKKTGVCLWDLKKMTPIYTTQLITLSEGELQFYGLKTNIRDCLNSVLEKFNILKEDILLFKEAMPTQLHGGASTVQTFIALAKTHAVFDLYTYEEGLFVYDYIGIYPITTHSYLKKCNGWENSHKVDKKDIQEYVESNYGLRGLTPDEYDAVFLSKTFVEVKWDKDLEERIKEIKRHKKELKSPKALSECDMKIKELEGNMRKNIFHSDIEI